MKGKVFNSEMVQAILKDDKTQFREPIKLDLGKLDTDINDKDYLYLEDEYGDSHYLKEYSPYQVGDTIFVKETWKLTNPFGDFAKNNRTAEYVYKTGYAKGKRIPITRKVEKNLGKWRPALYMPKEAARIFLKIKDIKVQRLQDITEDEVFKEGIVTDELEDTIQAKEDIARGLRQSNIPALETNYYREDFKNKWDIKYQSRGYGWNENPWVWCIEFERVEKSEADGYR